MLGRPKKFAWVFPSDITKKSKGTLFFFSFLRFIYLYVFLAVLDLCCSGISVVSVSRGYFWLLCAASHCGDSLVAESGLYELLLLLLHRFSRV